MTWADAVFSAGIVGMNLACFWMGRSIGPQPKTGQSVAKIRQWVRLPSGYSHEYAPGLTGYVMPTDDGAYWWLSRRGRTLIEGPCRNVDDGKREVATAAREMLGWAASSTGVA